MKCKGEKCSSYLDNFFYPICYETTYRINTDAECNLLSKIEEVKTDLIRRCNLFEELLDIDMDNNSLNDLVNRMED